MSTTYILDGIWGWHDRWEPMRRHIEKKVGPCRIWKYNNSGRVSLETVAAELVAELSAQGETFNLVGYSMGGLVARETIRQSPALPLHRAALLHSPHEGSLVAHLLPILPACREMRPGSEFLRRLDAHEWARPTMVTWCAADLMVFPGKSACWKKQAMSWNPASPPTHGRSCRAASAKRSLISCPKPSSCCLRDG